MKLKKNQPKHIENFQVNFIVNLQLPPFCFNFIALLFLVFNNQFFNNQYNQQLICSQVIGLVIRNHIYWTFMQEQRFQKIHQI